MYQTLFALALVFGSCSANAANTDRPSSLHLEITRDGNFQVLASRARSHGIGILFGLVGVGVVSASKTGQDQERAAAVSSEAHAANCRSGFESALRDRLENSGFVFHNDPSDRSPSLEVEIIACGFRILERPKEEMAAFFEAKYRFVPHNADRAVKPKRLFQTGEFRGGWMEFEESPTLATSEFQKVLERAGQTLANRIVFSEGN